MATEKTVDPEEIIDQVRRMLVETTYMRSEAGVRETQDELLDAIGDAMVLSNEVVTVEHIAPEVRRPATKKPSSLLGWRHPPER